MRLKASVMTVTFLLAALLPAAPASAEPFSVRVSSTGLSGLASCFISVRAGGTLEFPAHDLERRISLPKNSLKGITITALPAREQGCLFLGSTEVEHYQYLSRSDLDRLRFAAPSSPGSAVIGFMPLVSGGESLSVALNVQVGSEENHPPVLQSASVETGRNIPAFGVLSAKDPEGDPVSVTLIEPPKKGTASFDGLFFRYDPFHNRTGDDYFIVRAADSNGAWSAEATVGVSIARQRLEFYYADMTAHPYQFAALMLHKEGVYTGRRVGDSYFFEPDGVMNRGEFITMLITAAGLAGGMTPTVNTGLLNDGEIPAHLKRYVKRAVDEGIISPELSFYYDEIPSRAEAVVLADRAAKISDVKAFELSMPDSGEIPDWATPSYRDLAAYRMLDLYDGYARPGRALDNGYAAGLIWQLYKHARR